MGWSLTPAMCAWHLETGINTFSASLADTGGGDGGADLAQHRADEHQADGADDDICMRAIVANGAFPCGAAVRTCLDHGGRGNGVDADAQHLVLRALFFELLDQRTADAAAPGRQ